METYELSNSKANESYLGDSRRDTYGYDSPEFDHSSGHMEGSYQGNTETQGIMGNRDLTGK